MSRESPVKVLEKTYAAGSVGGEDLPRITVIVPVKNEALKLGTCLEALRSQTLPPSEVIVVDGYSTDDTVKIARNWGAITYYEDYGTRGGACQIGVDHAQGDFVAFTDADCIPDRGWLEILHEELTRNRVAAIAGVGCRIVNRGKEGWERAIGAVQSTSLGSGNSVQGKQFAQERLVVSISGCHSMYTRETIRRVGGFRCDLETCEDTELNRRIRKQVGPLLYTPRTQILHKSERGVRSFTKRMFQYGAGRAQARLLGVPVLLPLAAPLALATIFVWPMLLAILALIYGLLLASLGVLIYARERDRRMLYMVPTVFAFQHTAYVLGFWAYIFRLRR